MGLRCSFTITDAGYKDSVSAMDAEGNLQEVPVDYSAACAAFVSTFLEVANSLVPVRTGYLKSTISASSSGNSVTAEASAHYAQYVEYGTWRMAAQPYFNPAIQAAMEAFGAAAQEAVHMAEDMLNDILTSIQAAVMSAVTGGGDMFSATTGEFIGGTLLSAGAMILLFPILVNLYGMIKTIDDALNTDDEENSRRKNDDDFGGGFMPNITIY